MADKKKIKAFVQDVLGCGCAEEVFRHIEDTQAQVAGEPCERIDIGGRLLVYVFRADDPRWAEKELAGIVRSGVAERDAKGFNRFRLVLATDADQVRSVAIKAYRKMGPADDRTFLHVVTAAQACFQADRGTGRDGV